jgi:hypothetical protein
MLKELDTYDWEEAFGYAGKEEGTCAYWQGRDPVKTIKFCNIVSEEPFDREDVEEIVAMDEGENDGSNWIGVFKLKDGRYATIDAGCDYTGWDCQAGGIAEVAGTLEEVIQYGLDDGQRKRLKLFMN